MTFLLNNPNVLQLTYLALLLSRACHQNRSIYDVLNLESRVNVSEVLTFANNPNLQDALDNIKQRLNVEGQIVILLPSAKKKLEELAESSPSIPFDVYTEVVWVFFFYLFCYICYFCFSKSQILL